MKVDYRNIFDSIFNALEKYGSVLWKYLSFSLADNFFSMARVVSISIESDGIYFIFGTKIFWKIAIKSFKKYPLEEDKELTPEYLATVVSKAVDEMGANRASFILNIPADWVIERTAEFPATVRENLANVISYELDRLTPLTPDNAYYDYKIIDDSADKIKVFLTVAKADRINPFLEALKLKKIKIEKLGVSTFVIRSLIKDTYKIKDAVFISVHEKSYECGAVINDFKVRSLSGQVRSWDDSQVHQIINAAKLLIDLFPKGNPSRIVIHADEKYYKMFADKLSGLPVANLTRNSERCVPKGDKNISPFALGSFLEMVAADQNEFNLLTGKNMNPNTQPFILSLVLLAAILFLGAFYLFSPVLIEQKNIEQIDARIKSLKPEMKKIEALNQEIATISSGITAINDFKKNSIPKMDVLKEVTNILPEKTWLTRVRFTEDTIEIEGYAGTATEIIPKLENSRYFQKAEFASPTYRDQRQNTERFVIKMELRDESKPVKPEKTGEKHEPKK